MGSLCGGGALRGASGEHRSSDKGVRPEHLPGFSFPPSLPLWLLFFFPLLSLPLPFLFVKGGGRQRRAGVSGRGLEFHLNDCPSAHAAPRSRPARALPPAAGRPAGGRPRHGPGTAGAPCSPAPDRASFGAAELAFRAPRTSAGSQAKGAARSSREGATVAATATLGRVRLPRSVRRGARPDASRGAERRPRDAPALVAPTVRRPVIWNLDHGVPLQGWCPGRGPGAARRLPLGTRQEEETQPAARAARGPRLRPLGGGHAEGAGD